MKYRISMHRLRHFAPRQLRLIFLAVCIIPGLLQAAPPNLRGSLGIHDPSTIIQCNGRYYVFGTGGGIGSFTFPFLMAMLAQAVGIRGGFIFYLGVCVLLAVMAGILARIIGKQPIES